MKTLSIEAAAGERTLTCFACDTEKKPFGITVSDRAVYFVELDRWALKEPWVVRRIPIEQVRLLELRRTRPLAILALATLLVLGGGALTVLMFWGLFEDGERGVLSAWPIFLLLSELSNGAHPYSWRASRNSL